MVHWVDYVLSILKVYHRLVANIMLNSEELWKFFYHKLELGYAWLSCLVILSWTDVP